MTTEAPQSACKYCREPIKTGARVCYHCGRSQQFFAHNFDRMNITISICLLIAAILQSCDARQEHIKATQAKHQINDAGKIIATALLALSSFDGTWASLEAQRSLSPLLIQECESLLDVLDVTHTEREQIHQIHDVYRKWMESVTVDGHQQIAPSDMERLRQELKQLTTGRKGVVLERGRGGR